MKNPSEKQYTPDNTAEIMTYGGEYFHFLEDNDYAGLSLEGIAHALALTNRFGGHTAVPYSVAEHSVRVSNECRSVDARWGLLHDAAEAFIGDMPGPLKADIKMSEYSRLEERILMRIAEYYELPWPMPESVKRADCVLCATEARDLMGIQDPVEDWHLPLPPLEDRIVPVNWKEAKRLFITRAKQLGLRM